MSSLLCAIRAKYTLVVQTQVNQMEVDKPVASTSTVTEPVEKEKKKKRKADAIASNAANESVVEGNTIGDISMVTEVGAVNGDADEDEAARKKRKAEKKASVFSLSSA